MSEQSHYVYIMAKVGGLGPVKVGISNNPRKRLATIATACPFPIELVFAFECPNLEIARYMEKMFHETRGDHHLHGEWFDYQPAIALQLMCLAFRVAFFVNVGDDSLIEPSLELCGVIEAERLCCGTPPAVMQ